MDENTQDGPAWATITAVFSALIPVVIGIGAEAYGELPHDTGIAISAALGNVVSDVMERVITGEFDAQGAESAANDSDPGN